MVDGGDAKIARLARGAEVNRFAVDEELTVVWLVDSGKDLDETRLTGPVVAEDAQHLARVNLRVDVLQGDHVPVELGDRP